MHKENHQVGIKESLCKLNMYQTDNIHDPYIRSFIGVDKNLLSTLPEAPKATCFTKVTSQKEMMETEEHRRMITVAGKTMGKSWGEPHNRLSIPLPKIENLDNFHFRQVAVKKEVNHAPPTINDRKKLVSLQIKELNNAANIIYFLAM